MGINFRLITRQTFHLETNVVQRKLNQSSHLPASLLMTLRCSKCRALIKINRLLLFICLHAWHSASRVRLRVSPCVAEMRTRVKDSDSRHIFGDSSLDSDSRPKYSTLDSTRDQRLLDYLYFYSLMNDKPDTILSFLLLPFLSIVHGTQAWLRTAAFIKTFR